MKKTVLYVLQQAKGLRPLSPEAITKLSNQMLEAPATVAAVRATLAELESQGFAARRASVLDPGELTWLVTPAGKDVDTL